MISEKLVRQILWFSLGYNCFAAYGFSLPGSAIGQFIQLPPEAPVLYSALLGFTILVFGFLYGWLAMQKHLAQPLLFVGATGKIAFFCLGFILWLQDLTTNGVVLILLGDLIMGTIWLLWFKGQMQKSA